MYALLFADHGLSTGEIGSLLILWSAAAFLLEVPSGAWADMVDRRLLLALGAAIQACGFAVWMLWPSYLGFAAGFLLWSLASALQSGTFEALVYDELAAHGATERYAGLIGVAQGIAMATMTGAIALAAPLYTAGGYPLVGWVSVAVALLGVAAAAALPRAPSMISVAHEIGNPDGGAGPESGEVTSTGGPDSYLGVLRLGVHEAVRTVAIRRVLMLLFMVIVLVAVDEYFPLLVAERGIATGDVPWLIAGASLLQAAGTSMAGWTARWSHRRFGALVAAAGVLCAVGVGLGAPWALLLVGLGYGLANNAMVATEARLQHRIEGRARATVTSVAGLVKEAAALVGFALIAWGATDGVSRPIALVAGRCRRPGCIRRLACRRLSGISAAQVAC